MAKKKNKPEITKATVKVKAGEVDVYVKKPASEWVKTVTNVYGADYKLIDDTIEDIKKVSRKVCTNDYATNNVYLILQFALKKIVSAEA
jgi:hypothetical protein